MPPRKFAFTSLLEFAVAALTAEGLTRDRAATVALALVNADSMGHDTHGLSLLPAYVKALHDGGMNTRGEPEVVRDTGATLTWDGRQLPGPWLTQRAIDIGLKRVPKYGVVTIVIRHSHHIASLAVYPERVARQGYLFLLSCSDPSYNRVAPYGGITGVYSPNPIAAGIPTQGEPIIMDISTSATASGTVARAKKSGRRLPAPWLLDAEGVPTDDPDAFIGNNDSTILPLGGIESGYKGFALGVLVDAMTGALGGFGRADQPAEWTSTTFLQLIDPAAFGGREAFVRETQFLADRSRASKTRSGDPPVRMPGERALRLRRERKETGVPLADHVVAGLEELAAGKGLDFPEALEGN